VVGRLIVRPGVYCGVMENMYITGGAA
jgi:hypothetical protein